MNKSSKAAATTAENLYNAPQQQQKPSSATTKQPLTFEGQLKRRAAPTFEVQTWREGKTKPSKHGGEKEAKTEKLSKPEGKGKRGKPFKSYLLLDLVGLHFATAHFAQPSPRWPCNVDAGTSPIAASHVQGSNVHNADRGRVGNSHRHAVTQKSAASRFSVAILGQQE